MNPATLPVEFALRALRDEPIFDSVGDYYLLTLDKLFADVRRDLPGFSPAMQQRILELIHKGVEA